MQTNTRISNQRNDLDHTSPRWFAFYVHPQCEKTVHTELLKKGIESYCPIKKEIRQWSDRTKLIEVPIFRSYAFAKIRRDEYYTKIKYIDKIIKIVDIGGEIISIKDKEMEWIKLLEHSDFESIHPSEIQKGDKVRILFGGMKGVEGNIIYQSGKCKLGLELNFMQRMILFEIDLHQIEKA